MESRTRGSRPRTQKKIRGQGQPFRGQTFLRPRTGMLETKAKDQGHKRKCSPKKIIKGLQKNFSGDLKKSLQNFFQAFSSKKRLLKFFFQAIYKISIQWNSVNKSTVNKSSRLLHPICLERNRLVHFRKRRLLKLPRIKFKTSCPEVDLLTEFHCNSKKSAVLEPRTGQFSRT